MKIKLLMTGLLALISVAVFAQKGALKDAKDGFDSYDIARGNKLTLPQAIKSLADAKTAIDKAAVNDKTAALPATFALKGVIYSALAMQDTVPATSEANFKISDEALKKAKSLDSAKQENKAVIDKGFHNLAQYKFDQGRKQFENKKYDQAYQDFDYTRQVMLDDTTELYATGLAAANQGATDPKYYGYAITNYSKLLKTNYSGNVGIYHDLSSIYLAQKDTANALRVVGEGVAKYPSNNELRKREIQISLVSGKTTELVSKIQDAIKADPKNKELYYYLGLTYSQIADTYGAKIRAAKTDAAKVAPRQSLYDYYAKAGDSYKQAIAIDPNYFEANLNMGYVLVNTAIEERNYVNNIPANQQKQYDAALAKEKQDIELPKPYIDKALSINPKSVDALDYLKHYYLAKDDMTDANATQKKIEALGGN